MKMVLWGLSFLPPVIAAYFVADRDYVGSILTFVCVGLAFVIATLALKDYL